MTPIQLTYIEDTAYTFNVDDYMKIRVEYRMPGKLVGCSAKWPLNSNLHGLPAIYTPYEARLLVEKGYAILVRKDFSQPPSDAIKEEYQQIRSTNIQQIEEFCRENKVKESKNIVKKIIAGKRKKCQKTGVGNPDEITEESVLTEIRNNFKFNVENAQNEVPTKEAFNIGDVSVVTDLPEVDPLFHRIFCDFWERGKWVTCGERFGADFLVYPGEPMYFHASHLIHVMKDVQNNRIPVKDLVTKGRLSVVVNKFCIFAWEHPESKELCFQTLQWENERNQSGRNNLNKK